MRSTQRLVYSFLLSFGVAGCQTDYAELPTFSVERKLLQAVVESPAGTNHVRQYNSISHEFAPQQRAGKDWVLQALPYPGNYGFVPGTRTEAGNPLPVLVLAESQSAGTVLEVLPIGLVLLDKAGTLERVVVAVPARPSQQILAGATTSADFVEHYPAAYQMLRLWFQHHAAPVPVRIMSWRDEAYAMQYVRSVMR